jgi:hypothetical protein
VSEQQIRLGLIQTLDRLRRERVLEATRVTEYGVRRLLEVARTDWERGLDTMRFRPADFDFHYKILYEALLSGADAVVAALGYRVKGGDSSHEVAFRIAVYALGVEHRAEANRLAELKDHARSIRRRATYERVGLVDRRERDEFAREVADILRALEMVACGVVRIPLPGHRWQAPG